MGEKTYRLWRRADRNGVYYVRLPGESWKSTNCTDRPAAEAYAADLVAAKRVATLIGRTLPDDTKPATASVTLAKYAHDFFLWEPESDPKCPHCRRVLASGGQIAPEHAQRMRRLLERFLIGDDETIPDDLASKRIGEINRGDCIEYRARVIASLGVDVADRDATKGKRVASLTMTALSTVFSEAIERGLLDSNPAARLAIKYSKQKRGVFNSGELRKLFPAAVDDLGPWPDPRTKAAFLTAGACGLRRNEVRALRWHAVDFENGGLHIVEAFKGNKRPGAQKWDKRRTLALPGVVARHLLLLKRNAESEGYVFANIDGSPLGTQVWKVSWRNALKSLEIDASERSLVPHSLRHSIATELRARGVSDILLKQGLGWSSDAMLEHYSDHFGAEQLQSQARVVDDLFA